MPLGIAHLRRRSEFLRAARSGHSWAVPGLVLQVRPHDRRDELSGVESVRVGFTVSRKVGNAVKRNRAKRRLRAAVRHVFSDHAGKGCDYVIIGRAATLRRSFHDLIGDLETALERLLQTMTDKAITKAR